MMVKPKIPSTPHKYFETNKFFEANEMIRSGQWELHRIEIEVANHRASKTLVLIDRQVA
jgi:hypothetical protein